MTTQQLIMALDNVDDRYIAEAAAVKRKAPLWIKVTSAAAACVAVLVGVAAALFIRLYDPTPSLNGHPPLTAIEELVEEYDPSTFSSDGNYPLPSDGKVLLLTEVQEALQEYAGQNRYYLIYILLTSHEKMVLDAEEIMAEYARISEAMGVPFYDVPRLSNWRDDSVVLGVFTEKQLKHFAASPDYGYMLGFAPYTGWPLWPEGAKPVFFEEPTVIYRYPIKGMTGSYRLEGSGRYILYDNVRQATEEYKGENVRYLLRLELYKAFDHTAPTEQEVLAEYRRISWELDVPFYELPYPALEEYALADKAVQDLNPTQIVGLFREDQLKRFAPSEEYICMVYFPDLPEDVVFTIEDATPADLDQTVTVDIDKVDYERLYEELDPAWIAEKMEEMAVDHDLLWVKYFVGLDFYYRLPVTQEMIDLLALDEWEYIWYYGDAVWIAPTLLFSFTAGYTEEGLQICVNGYDQYASIVVREERTEEKNGLTVTSMETVSEKFYYVPQDEDGDWANALIAYFSEYGSFPQM